MLILYELFELQLLGSITKWWSQLEKDFFLIEVSVNPKKTCFKYNDWYSIMIDVIGIFFSFYFVESGGGRERGHQVESQVVILRQKVESQVVILRQSL